MYTCQGELRASHKAVLGISVPQLQLILCNTIIKICFLCPCLWQPTPYPVWSCKQPGAPTAMRHIRCGLSKPRLIRTHCKHFGSSKSSLTVCFSSR